MKNYLVISLIVICNLVFGQWAHADEKVNKASDRKITVQVGIDQKLASKSSGEWTLYVYASKPGARLPLANYKGKLSEIPAEIVLYQSMYLLPHLTLNEAEQVVVVAKATQSKNPHQKSNEDIIGYSSFVTFDSGPHQQAKVTIDQHDKPLVKKAP